MTARAQLFLEFADDELVLGWHNSESTGIAPSSRRTSPSPRSRRTRSGMRAPPITSPPPHSTPTPTRWLRPGAGPGPLRAAPPAPPRPRLGAGRSPGTSLRDRRRDPDGSVKEHDDAELAGLAAKIDREEVYHRLHADVARAAPRRGTPSAALDCGRMRSGCSGQRASRCSPSASGGRRPSRSSGRPRRGVRGVLEGDDDGAPLGVRRGAQW